MNTDEQPGVGEGDEARRVETDEVRDPSALAELRSRLEAGRIARGLNQTELARAAGLGRTTVSRALSSSAPGPSSDTVGALGRALRLDVTMLLGLLEAAYGRGPAAAADAALPGKPIRLWDPHDLEVHFAVEVPGAGTTYNPSQKRGRTGRSGRLPAYVRRPHDEHLVAIVEAAEGGHSGMAVLVGSSSTGKTRACWEAIQPLAATGWRLWHPFDPTRADAALADLHRVEPRTVVWLNDSQQYLGGDHGERIAAALHGLLTDVGRSPVLVLGTLWPEYQNTYLALPPSGCPDPHAQVRALLAGRLITLPDSFDNTAINKAMALASAGDRQLAHALSHVDNGRLTQFLAGAPELLRRYDTASPPVRALLEVAIDARRLGAGLHLPVSFLEQAVEDYLSDDEYDDLADNWLDQAFADVTHPVHGRLAPLRRVRPRPARRSSAARAPSAPAYRLADYLEQHGRRLRARLCPPESFWQAAHDHLPPESLSNLAEAARIRHRSHWAERLAQRAADAGSATALARLAQLRKANGSWQEADQLFRQAVEAGSTDALIRLAVMREEAGHRGEAEDFAQQAADAGDIRGLGQLAELREAWGNREDAERLAVRAALAGDTGPLVRLAEKRELAGSTKGAERLGQLAANAGDTTALVRLAAIRETYGSRNGAQRLYQRAARVGNASALVRLAVEQEAAGNRHGAEQLAWRAADMGQSFALVRLAEMREAAGARQEAEKLAQQAIDAGHRFALLRIAAMREAAGDHKGAEHLCRQAAEAGNPTAVARLVEMRESAGDREGATLLAREAAKEGNPSAASRLADLREAAGDRQEAEHLAALAADIGDSSALARLAEMRELAGDAPGAERLAQDAAERGNTSALLRLADMREAAGDHKSAGQLVRLAAHAGDTEATARVALMRERAGDSKQADLFARLAADAGNPSALARLRELRSADRGTTASLE
ncbi:helix-turn-helix domain-containing protein [Streptomyces actuosus]|uniref:Transcriptional regulator n=2 Tax=Streptomyces TaxID=1883 RepID=A0A2U9PE69_STRAS|nr:transcriptional regulator [Streptomyces actuosus]MBM4824005.1 helix-turn-helix domain-containing protein [Streptomyces actuosus]